MLKLVQTDNGVFDIAFADPAMPDENAAVATLVYATLFTDQIIPLDRATDPFDKRGWWHDEARGTGLWYVRRQALSSAARQEAINMVKQALLAKSPALSDIVVTDVSSARNVSSVTLEVAGKHNGIKFTMRASL